MTSATHNNNGLLSINFPLFSKKMKEVKILSKCNGELECFNGSTMGVAIGSTFVTTIKGEARGSEYKYLAT